MFICILFFYMLVFITTPQVVSFPRGARTFSSTAPRRPSNFPLMHGGNHSGFFFFFWRRCPTRRKSKILTILYKKREISTKIVRYKVHLWPGISASSLNFVTIVRVFFRFVCMLGDTTSRGGLNQLHEKRKSSSTRVWGSHLDRC